MSKDFNGSKNLYFIISIFCKIVSNIGDFTHFEDFSNLTKHKEANDDDDDDDDDHKDDEEMIMKIIMLLMMMIMTML